MVNFGEFPAIDALAGSVEAKKASVGAKTAGVEAKNGKFLKCSHKEHS
jgi:hypothetical protein